MKGDFSRKTFDSRKRYSGVLMQQGRVQLDADWNEQRAIDAHRTEQEAVDSIGRCGVPKKSDGFRITPLEDNTDLSIAAGRIYVGGLLCEAEATTYTTQPDLPAPQFTHATESGEARLQLPDGDYLAYLHVWQRHVTALDDERIREVALGGADTTTRVKNIWQVELLNVTAKSEDSSSSVELSCQTQFPEWDALIAPSTGMMNARTEPTEEPTPCLLPPSAGYRRLENQLYRVEVHRGGARDAATFKWSRDNGSIETTVEEIDGATLTVAEIGKDDVLGFAGGDWVEIVNEESELKAQPRSLALIESIEPATRKITLDTSLDALKDTPRLKLRRWNQAGDAATTDGMAMTGGWLALEDGIQVQFSEGQYRAGDYWLIPARTATGEIEWSPFATPNTDSQPQPPHGIEHHYCRLALLHSTEGNIKFVTDCREQFPALTDICAEDVCFDNSECDFPDAKTVQDALDALCKARDLRHHNKHLHGWGIVCGLQVHCGQTTSSDGQRRRVTVLPGYAIDCEGNDIILERAQSLDVFEMIAEHKRLNPNPPNLNSSNSNTINPNRFDRIANLGELDDKGNGEVCLVFDRNAKRRFILERYEPKAKGWAGLLENTLLMDVFQDCIGSLSDFARKEFQTDETEGKALVSPTQKRITTLMNLIIQLSNPTWGRYVYLSGEAGTDDSRTEHVILRDFYERLRALLQSKTFCAMFEGARRFPEYPFKNLDTHTVFGKGFHTRLRLHPNGKTAYTVGAGNKIHVFDLEKREMSAELEFPGGKGALVQDVAFSSKGDKLYAAATLDDKDTLFAIADVSGANHKWRNPSVICDVLLSTLGTLNSAPEKLYAIGKGKGLFEFNPEKPPADTPAPIYAFNAVGHLVIANAAGQAFATARDPKQTPEVYDRVLRLDFREKGSPQPTFFLGQSTAGANFTLTGEDDIAISFDNKTQKSKLYVVVNPAPNSNSTNKRLLIFDAFNQQQPASNIDLEDDTAIRLAYNPVTARLMLTYEDRYGVSILNADDRLESKFHLPVQISPLAIAVAPNRERVYVLNVVSNTITSIPARGFSTNEQLDLDTLAKYRAAIFEAYTDLLGGLLQYLKDCLCDHLLVNCPQCEPDDKIYLACIQIKNNQIYRVCNFSQRKYVKSFPTVEYWLSLVPLVPVIGKAVEAFCCSVLPGYFSRFNAPTANADTRNYASGATMRGGVSSVQQTDLGGMFRNLKSKWMPGVAMMTDSMTRDRSKQATTVTAVVQKDVVGASIRDAQANLERNNIQVAKIEKYDSSKGVANLRRFASAPANLAPGTRLTLVEENGVVRYYTLATEERTSVDAPNTTSPATRKEAHDDSLREEVSTLREELTRLRAAHEKELAQRDEAITSLRASTSELQSSLKSLGKLQEKVDGLIERGSGRKLKKDNEPPPQ